MSNDLIIDEGTEFFGETAFDRVHLENKIKDLEEKLSQAGRIHEGLIKDKDEAFEERFAEAKERVASAEGRSKSYQESYNRLLRTSVDERKKATQKIHTIRKDYDELLDELCLKDEQGEKLRTAILEYERNVANHVRATTVQSQVAEHRALVNRAAMEFLFKFILKHSDAFGHFMFDAEGDLFRKINRVFHSPPPLPIWHDPIMDPLAFLQKEWEGIEGKHLPWESLVDESGEIRGIVMPDINVGDYLRWGGADDDGVFKVEGVANSVLTVSKDEGPTDWILADD